MSNEQIDEKKNNATASAGLTDDQKRDAVHSVMEDMVSHAISGFLATREAEQLGVTFEEFNAKSPRSTALVMASIAAVKGILISFTSETRVEFEMDALAHMGEAQPGTLEQKAVYAFTAREVGNEILARLVTVERAGGKLTNSVPSGEVADRLEWLVKTNANRAQSRMQETSEA